MSITAEMHDINIERDWLDGLKALEEQIAEAPEARQRVIRIGKGLLAGRVKCPANIDFGEWIEKTGYASIERNERQDSMWLALNDTLVLPLLQTSDMIYAPRIRRYIRETHPTVYAQCCEFRSSAVMTVNATDSDKAAKKADIKPISNPCAAKAEADPPKFRPAGSQLVKQHGKPGEVVYNWCAGANGNNGGAYLFAKFKSPTVKRLAKFLQARADTLPSERSKLGGASRVTLGTFWAAAPKHLVKQVMGKNDEQTVLNVIEAWDKVIAPVLAEWRAAGEPENSDEWFVRSRPTVKVTVTPPSATTEPAPDFYAIQRERLVASLAKNPTVFGLKEDGHDQWPLPPPEPIRVHGLDIWPTSLKTYDWRAAYYGYNLFLVVRNMMREQRPAVQARMLMNPMGPLLAHINGPVGVVWSLICVQVHYHPELAEDTFGPLKVLQGY